MRVAVLGANGMLGHMVAKDLLLRGYEVFSSYRNPDPKDSHAFILDASWSGSIWHHPSVDYIINCIGAIPQRGGSDRNMVLVNSVFPHKLVNIAKVIHITTDCVFSGKRGNYTEDDEHDATDIYGVSKSVGEPGDAMVIRTSIVGTELGTKYNLLAWARSMKGQQVRGFVNHFWNGVTTKYLSIVFDQIMRKGIYCHGVFHIFSPDKLSKYHMLDLFDEKYNLELEISRHETSVVDRTLSTVRDLNAKFPFLPFREMLDL